VIELGEMLRWGVTLGAGMGVAPLGVFVLLGVGGDNYRLARR